MAFEPQSKTLKNYKFNCDLYNYDEIVKQLEEKPTYVKDHLTSWDEKKGMWTFSNNNVLLDSIYSNNFDELVIRLLHALNHFRINAKSPSLSFTIIQSNFSRILKKLVKCGLKIPAKKKLSAFNLLVIMESFLDFFKVSKILQDKFLRHRGFNNLMNSISKLSEMYQKKGGRFEVNKMLYYATLNLRRRLDAIRIIFWHLTNDLTVIITSENVVFSVNYDTFEGLYDSWFKNPFTKYIIKGNEVTVKQGFFYPYPVSEVYANLRDELPSLIKKSCYSYRLEQIEWVHEECKKPNFQEEHWGIISNYFDFCSEIADSKIENSMKRVRSNSLSKHNQEDTCEEDFIFVVLILAMKCLVKLVDGKYKERIPSILRRCFIVLNFLRIPNILLKVSLNSILLLSYFTHQLMEAVDQDKQILREIPADVVATIAMITYWVTKEHRKNAFQYKASGKPFTKTLRIIKKVKHAD